MREGGRGGRGMEGVRDEEGWSRVQKTRPVSQV